MSRSGNTVNKILEDQNGTLWLATDGGLCSFNSRSGKAQRYFITNNKLTTNTVNDIFEDRTGKLWIAQEIRGGESLTEKPAGITGSYLKINDHKKIRSARYMMCAPFQATKMAFFISGRFHIRW